MLKYFSPIVCIYLLSACSKPDFKILKGYDGMSGIPLTPIELNDFSKVLVEGDWTIANNVTSDLITPKLLKIEEGTGVAVFTGQQGYLSSNQPHADIELAFDFILPKESSFQLFLQGRYGINISDSWGKEVLSPSDCGGIAGVKSPIKNVSRAPGLWQSVKIVYRAPIFEGEVKKKNALINEVVINGMVVQQNVMLSKPSKNAPVKNEEPSESPFIIKASTGSFAIKNLKYKTTGVGSLKIDQINYSLYEGKWRQIPQFDTLQATDTGITDSFSVDHVTALDKNFAINYITEIEVEKPGNYMFFTVSDDASKLYINDSLVVDNGGRHGAEEKSGFVYLGKGSHSMHLAYYQSGGGHYNAVLYEGPQMAKQGLASIYDPNIEDGSPNIILNPVDEVELLRSFVYSGEKKRTHCISVGDPEGIHYTYDLAMGSLLQLWRGGFANTADMWHKRGTEQTFEPLGVLVKGHGNPDIARLNDVTMHWPDSLNEGDYTLKKYELDNKGRPIFEFELYGWTFKDRLYPENGKLIRELMVLKSGKGNLWMQAGVSDEITDVSKNLFRVGDHYIEIDKTVNGQKIKHESITELVIGIPAEAGAKVKYSIIW